MTERRGENVDATKPQKKDRRPRTAARAAPALVPQSLALMSPAYPALRRRFRLAVTLCLAAGMVVAFLVPGWLAVGLALLVGLGGTALTAWWYHRANDALARKLVAELRDAEISGPHIPGS